MRRILCLLILLSWTGCDLAADDGDTRDVSNSQGQPGDSSRGASGEPSGSTNEEPGSAEQEPEAAPRRVGIGDGETGARAPVTSIGGGADAGALAPVPAAGGSVGAVGFGAAGPGGGAVGGGGSVGAGSFAGGVGGVAGGVGGVAGGGGSGVSAPTTSAPVASDPGYESGASQVQVQAGQLTVGAWDDNLNYERFSAFRAVQYGQQTDGLLPFDAEEFDAAHARFPAARAPHQQLDVALVIDTTGSMGDEIRYLQSEFIALSSAIEAAYPDAEQRWALVLYRDVGDDYLTRYFDFRDDPQVFREKLAAQESNGGGDFPEAPEAAFEIMNQFAWREGAEVARLAFWVADAPHHAENAKKLAQGIRTAQAQDIHVYPVASSGIDSFTELGMRSAAQLTGGRYLFLTDDSGIGGAHLEPSIPCYFVTLLKHSILRMVEIEMSGLYREPDAAQVIRTGGEPEDGACTLESGATVVVF